jgi:two-component system phosphate regulon sensor histidine kinase PhoR
VKGVHFAAIGLGLAFVGFLISLLAPSVAVAFQLLAILGVILAAGGSYVAHREFARLETFESAERNQLALLERQEQRHRDALDQFASGLDVLIFLTDAQTQVIYANEKAKTAFGGGEMVGQRVLSATLSTELEQLIQSAARSREMQRQEIAFHHPGERIGVAQVWGEPPGYDRFFVSIYDITDLRRLERVRRDFVANVSHELRTPMTTIRAMAETLQDDDPDSGELRVRYLDKIVREVDRLTHITSDLLTLSQAESASVSRAPVDLADSVRTSCHFLEQKARDKGLDLIAETPASLVAMVNESQFSQVIVNLIDNAISYTEKGSVTVRLTSDAAAARLEIQDTGIGIPPEHLPRIFERFYRVDKGRSRATGGTGLGLAIVRHIVESHGGRVGVTSELGKGTLFWVTLPLG